MKDLKVNKSHVRLFILITLSIWINTPLCGQSSVILRVDRYASGEIKSKYALIDSVKWGYCVDFYINGSVEAECVYENGKLNGPFYIYYENGKLKREGFWNNDLPNGQHCFYEMNGYLQRKGSYSWGKHVGIWEYYFEGKIDKKVLYANDSMKCILLDNKKLPSF
jgi:antitoxin component YwqK of YwqJK toxin-antitoxin module